MADQENAVPPQETGTLVDHKDEQPLEGEAVQEAERPAQGTAPSLEEPATDKPKEKKRSMILCYYIFWNL